MENDNIMIKIRRTAKCFVFNSDYTLDKIFRDYEKKRLPTELNKFFTRPAYYGTSAQVNNSRFDSVNV